MDEVRKFTIKKKNVGVEAWIKGDEWETMKGGHIRGEGKTVHIHSKL